MDPVMEDSLQNILHEAFNAALANMSMTLKALIANGATKESLMASIHKVAKPGNEIEVMIENEIDYLLAHRSD